MLLFSNNNKYSHILKEVVNIRSSYRKTFYLNLLKFSYMLQNKTVIYHNQNINKMSVKYVTMSQH